MSSVEFSDLVIGMDSIMGRPAVVSDVVALPLDEVFKSSPAEAAVENLFNLVFFVITNEDWWRGRHQMASWNWIWLDKGQLDNGEDWVQLAH